MLTWILAIALSSAAVFFIGESPLHVWQVFLSSAIGNLHPFSFEPLSWTLFYSVPLFFTAAAVSLALEAGIFNIGAEGQLYVGAVAATAFGITVAPNNALGILGAGACAMLAAGFWATLSGVLKSRFLVHEVISGIMLNFVAMAMANWAILGPLKNPDTQALETRWISEALRVGPMWMHAPFGLALGILVIAIAWFLIKKTWWGYRVRAVGLNPRAADIAGIASQRTILETFFISGAIAGLVGFNEVFGHAYRLLDGFSSGFGFTGLAIALLARGNPVALIGYSVLFGAMYKGSLDLDLETEKITRDFSAVIQALILLSLVLTKRRGVRL